MTETKANRPTEELTEEELSGIARRPASAANAIPVGVPLDREKVESLLRAREAIMPHPVNPYEDPDEVDARVAEAYPMSAALGAAPVLWEAKGVATRHLLCARGRRGSENVDAFRGTLLRHVEEHAEFWQAVVLSTEAEQVRTLSTDIPRKGARGRPGRLLVVVEYPSSQEVLSLLAEFAHKAKAASSVETQAHLAVLTDTPAAIPGVLMRQLGFRVCFQTTRSDSRDMVGDDSAATLPWAGDFRGSAVVYDEWLAHDPELGSHRVDLPGRRFGRRRDVYVASGANGEGGEAR